MDLDAATFGGEIRTGLDTSRLHILNIFLESLIGVAWSGNPDLIAIEVAHNVHIGVIGEGILGDKIDVGADFGGVDHVGGYEASGIGTAEEDGVSFHGRWVGFAGIGGPLGLKFLGIGIPVTEVIADAINSAELPVTELPTEVMSILFSTADDFELAGVFVVFIDESEGEEEDEGGANEAGEWVVFDEGLESGHKQKESVAKPEDVNGVRLDILHASDKEVLNVGFGILENHEDEADREKGDEGGY